jgi:hypothetical protein
VATSTTSLWAQPFATRHRYRLVDADAREWADLAMNAPGQSARRQALAAREAAPIKTVLARILRVDTDERAWRVGADGEEEVARRLRKLGDGWHVLHAVPVGTNGSDIDHVVIGPGGVFTLNTKNRRGKKVWTAEKALFVNGQRTDYLRNSRHEAERAARLLSSAAGASVHVEPVIVVISEKLTIKHKPDGVHVVSRRATSKIRATSSGERRTGNRRIQRAML